jgi:hypothetical protein
MEFVEKVREKVETMGFGKQEHYTRVRPVRKDGRVLLRVDTKRIEGGKFKGLAYWRVPPSDKENKQHDGAASYDWKLSETYRSE